MSRITRALLALALLALAAPASAAADPTLVPVGSFATPIFVTVAAARRQRGCSWSSAAASIRLVKSGARSADAVPRHLRRRRRRTASAACSRWPSRPTTRPPGCSTSTWSRAEPDGRAPDPRVPPLGGERRRRRSRRADRVLVANHHGREQPQRRPRRVRARTATCGSRTGDGGGARRATRTTPSQPARQGAADRPAPATPDEYTVPPGNPSTARRCGRTGLRNPFRFSFDRVDRRPRDRRRRRGRARGGRLRALARASGAAATTAGRAARDVAGHAGTCAVSGTLTDPVFDFAAPRVHRGHRRRTSCATPACRRCAAATSTPTTSRASSARSRSGSPRATDDRPTGIARGARTLAAFGEDACGHVYVVSIDGSVDRIQDGALGPCVPAAPPAPRPRRRHVRRATVRPDHTSPRVNIRVARKGRVGPPRDAADRCSPRPRTAA